jgi:hemoglobin-like flavoprotein
LKVFGAINTNWIAALGAERKAGARRNGAKETMEQTNELARIFNDSYERVMRAPGRKSGEFFVAFYDRLIKTSDEVASKFRNTDMAEQVRMLQTSVTILLNFFATGRQDDYLVQLGERHGKRGVGIPPRLYSVWLDCLVETVRQFDSKFNEELATAWRAVFAKGIEFMTSRYYGK